MLYFLSKIVALSSLVCGLGPDANPPRFAIITIPGFGGELTTARGINSIGYVTGASFIENNYDYFPYVYRDGTMAELPLLPSGEVAEGRAINDFDEVVGETYLTNGRLATATMWDRNGQVIDLNIWQSDFARAWSINNAGQAVGEANNPSEGNRRRAVLWENGQVTDLGILPVPGHTRSGAIDMNESTEIVGNSSGAIPARGFVWSSGQLTNLNWPEEEPTGAYGINDLSQIVGTGDSNREAVLWDNGIPSTLALRPNDSSVVPRHINNRGNIVGYVQRNVSGSSIYVIWPNAQSPYVEVQDLLPPQSLWRKIETVDDINDSAQMVGHGKRGPDSGLDAHGFLFTPVNWTFGLAAPSPGRAETTNTLRVSGVTPGATVHFYYSAHGGGAVIPGCTIQSNAMQLESPTLIGTATANGNGVASLSRYVPSIARNKSILFQAAVQGECAISQLVVWRFE